MVFCNATNSNRSMYCLYLSKYTNHPFGALNSGIFCEPILKFNLVSNSDDGICGVGGNGRVGVGGNGLSSGRDGLILKFFLNSAIACVR